MEIRSQNDIELHVKGVEKSGIRTEIENSGHSLAVFDRFQSDLLAGLRRIKYHDLEDMVHRKELTYDETMDVLNMK